jgi:hypothetical protein
MNAEKRWDHIDRGNPKDSDKICPSDTLSALNPGCTGLLQNPGIQSEKPATNRLIYGTARRKTILPPSSVLNNDIQPKYYGATNQNTTIFSLKFAV